MTPSDLTLDPHTSVLGRVPTGDILRLPKAPGAATGAPFIQRKGSMLVLRYADGACAWLADG